MIRIICITFVLVLVTIGGGISLSNAHGSAGKAAISSLDVFAPDAVKREIFAAPLQPVTRTGSAEVVTADVVTKDVTRADGFQWRIFGPSLAPQRGMRPKSRTDTQTQTAQVSVPQALSPPALDSKATAAKPNAPRARTTAAPALKVHPVPAVKTRSMHSNPNPGFLIGVFR
ncbi:hypothetical protein OS190_18930 [Sulfitobacter sp. F26204]|uniref:hypothetical protein n=1 Tax=Sulfitobacter sp. F26204 TaxID=2996014 RepID=UPI00225E3ECB|nr:hypothetical protein [Sulfitobacter sp. F26204]MCX7561642.1 hypothetical protein [Sulfitobacter sp. F26204]